MQKIFVIDDELDLCLTIKKILEQEGYSVDYSINAEQILQKIKTSDLSCILLDMKIGEQNGLNYIEKIKLVDPHLPIIMITAHDTTKTAVAAIKAGAFHYLAKPFDNEELKAIISQAIYVRNLYWELVSLQNKKTHEIDLEAIMGHSKIILDLIKQSSMVANTDFNVLITGESGSGKELVANNIHQLSNRRENSWIAIDCATIPETLIESELFGHEKGAFTGAHVNRIGKIETADQGTLFLDEIGNISYNIQAKLLRFLETRTFERLGGRTKISVNVRIIAATNKDLPRLIKDGIFREDLYHRLNEFPVYVKPLRERTEDIPYLALKFLNEFSVQVGKTFTGIDTEVFEILKSYPWPGNVRELKNIIKRAMVMAHEKIYKVDLPNEIINPQNFKIYNEMVVVLEPNDSLAQNIKNITQDIEKKLIIEALQKVNGRKGKAAKALGIDEKTLYNKIQQYKISLY
jgi:DNA-binding NtrC family response regulator